MFKVMADVRKNRLYITLGGHVSDLEARTGVEAILQEVAKLAPDFDLINDIAEARPTDEEHLKELMRVQKLLMSQGLRRVVRVTRVLITELQLERVSKDSGYHSIIVSSVEKAERLLDSLTIPESLKSARDWEQVRKYRRVSVGPEHTIRFTLAGRDLTGVRISNLSAEGCFALVQDDHASGVRDGCILNEFQFEHQDLPALRITAKVVRAVPGLSEVSEKDIGLGIQFLSTSQQFTDWVDAYVLAYYGLNH